MIRYAGMYRESDRGNLVLDCIDSDEFQNAARNSIDDLYDSIKNDNRLSHTSYDARTVPVSRILLDDTIPAYRVNAADFREDFKFGGLAFLKHALYQKVKYLGPLRTPPQGMHRLGSTNNNTVGTSGEHTARSLALSIDEGTVIYHTFLPPPDELEPKEFREEIDLEQMIQLWLEYLGVASSGTASFEKSGKGVSYQIKVDDESPTVDDRHVGVGVSQLMPVLVQGLLSNPGDILVFEQPELHMHPRIQSRLADFFVMLTKNNVQCIVETHSEHLINRLRLLRAQSSEPDSSEANEEANLDDSSSPDMKIYFATQDRGCTSFEEIEINKYGVIENWPEGFFDEAMNVTDQIMKAAIAKSRKEAKGIE